MSNRKKKKKRKKQLIILFILAIAFVALFKGYLTWAERGERTKAVFANADGTKSPVLSLNVANTPAERAKGLMFVKKGELSDEEGMLFIFDKEEDQSFWMRNTYISLDIIFIGSDLEVKGVLENVPALSDTSRSIGEPSIYIVELLAGRSKKFGIKAGSKIESKLLENM